MSCPKCQRDKPPGSINGRELNICTECVEEIVFVASHGFAGKPERLCSSLAPQFQGLSEFTMNRLRGLSHEEFAKLGNPVLIDGRCNCKEPRWVGYGWDNTDCARCGGSEY